MSSVLYPYVRSLFTTLYLLWAVLWAIVCFYYGRSSYTSWIRSGGRWKYAVRDVLAPFWWAIREQICRFRILRGANFCGTEIPSHYEPGNLLQFAIFLGSMTPIMFGIQFADLDRHDWTPFHVFTTLLFCTSSILAAGAHLFLAYKRRPNAWRRLVMFSTAWLLFAPPFFLVAYDLNPAGIPFLSPAP